MRRFKEKRVGLRLVRALPYLVAVLVLGATAGLAAPGDIAFLRLDGSQDFQPAVFPHWTHRIRYRCSVCHPAIFEMESGANAVTMESINEGKFCGACHNGRISFNVDFQTCTWCHKQPDT